jgi:hypothetical protein
VCKATQGVQKETGKEGVYMHRLVFFLISETFLFLPYSLSLRLSLCLSHCSSLPEKAGRRQRHRILRQASPENTQNRIFFTIKPYYFTCSFQIQTLIFKKVHQSTGSEENSTRIFFFFLSFFVRFLFPVSVYFRLLLFGPMMMMIRFWFWFVVIWLWKNGSGCWWWFMWCSCSIVFSVVTVIGCECFLWWVLWCCGWFYFLAPLSNFLSLIYKGKS